MTSTDAATMLARARSWLDVERPAETAVAVGTVLALMGPP